MPFWSSWKALEPALLARGGGGRFRTAVPPPQRCALDHAATGQACRVVAVDAPAGAPDWGRWLAEIGFLPGEHVSVTTRSVWGGDPMVVRVGQSTFALRRAEAACVQVEPL